MAEQIIDIRERIEKMRIKIDVEKNQSSDTNAETNKEKKNELQSFPDQNETNIIDHKKINENNVLNVVEEKLSSDGSYPSVNLSVKNPISTKSLVVLMVLQIFSNIGILFLLYSLLE